MKTIKIKKLVSTFKNSVGEKHNLTIKSPTVDKTPEEVHEALELLTTLDIFEEENGIKTFAEVVTAKYVETVKYIQFNPDAPVESEPLPEKPVKNPMPVSCLNPFKPINYEKFVDLVCPKALNKVPADKLDTKEEPIELDTSLPITRPIKQIEVIEVNSYLPVECNHSEDRSPSPTSSDKKEAIPKKRNGLLQKLSGISTKNST